MEDSQVLYLGRWVSRDHFCAFVYNKEGKKLAKSYDEYSQLISSGLWRAEPIKEQDNFNLDELIESQSVVSEPEQVVVEIKAKRGKKCHNQRSQ